MQIAFLSRRILCGWLFIGCSEITAEEKASDVNQRLAVIAQVGPNGAGSALAKAACEDLGRRGMEILPQLLVAMDTSNVVAANWLRTVYEPLVEKGLSVRDTKWPTAFLKDFVSDEHRRGKPRELALTLLDRIDPAFRESWIPTRLNDAHFRFQAVAAALTVGEKSLGEQRTDDAKAQFRKAFAAARDSGQVTQAASKLASLGEPQDVAKHLGLITNWQLLGPFDAPQKTGYSLVFPPEERIDLNAKYAGQNDAEIAWKPHETKDVLGTVNLNEAIAATKEAVGYAYTEIDVAAAGPAQLRCSADDNCTVWLNGEKVFGRDQWLNGTRFDRFITPITLKPGRNTLLVKICQGPQHRDPEVPNNWTFQLRLCDEQGAGVPIEVRR